MKAAVVAFLLIFLAIGVAVYAIVVNLMVTRLGISIPEAIALLIVAHAIFGGTASSVYRR
jgi:hypothetical protein